MNLSQVETMRSFGVRFPADLTRTPPIACLSTNLCRAIGALDRQRYYLPVNVKRHVYCTFSYSRLPYCFLFWYTTTQTNPNNLTLLQKQRKTTYCRSKVFLKLHNILWKMGTITSNFTYNFTYQASLHTKIYPGSAAPENSEKENAWSKNAVLEHGVVTRG